MSIPDRRIKTIDFSQPQTSDLLLPLQQVGQDWVNPAIGFDDRSYFKQVVGKTPGQFWRSQ